MRLMQSLIAAGVALGMVSGIPARAEPQFTAEDLLRHFSSQPAPAPQVQRQARTRDEAPLVLPMTGARRAMLLPSKKPAGRSGYDLMITFESGSDRLTPQARANLDAFARALSEPALAGAAFAIDGHTDAAGPDDFNLALSKRRAQSVVGYLVSRGVEGRRLTARGYGEARPLHSDPNDPSNRRVETRRLR